MDQIVLESLEFDKVLDRLAHFAASPLGKEAVKKIRPLSDPNYLNQIQEETQNAVDLLLAFSNPPLFGIYPVRPAVKRASLGGILSMGQLLEIAEGLRVARALIDYCKEAEASHFVGEIRSLFVQKGLEEAITSAIEAEGVMNDSASPALFRIRRAIKAKQDSIRGKLNDIMISAGQAGHLSENIITMRDGRYVLPVKAKSRGAFRGLVHDQSASGATVFMEPLAIVELNNEIRELEGEEKEEIQRILADFSMEVADFADEISGNEGKLQYIDKTFAKAKYALEIRGSRPVFTDDRSIDLKEARHPLLGKGVVPIDFSLGKDFSTLIITGPNTGGKTVTLKTVGLLQVMGQSGLQIPCRSNSKLGVFKSIYADIGDKQSIELSLSTFSASMDNIIKILANADSRSLLLFDEIGSGTDPVEGAALAMAILTRLTRRGIRTVATTHYSELKLFAIRSPGVQNASVEFDVQTLSPTYRLQIGLPGRSNAFEITKRLGMPEDLLNEAKNLVDSDSVQFEDVLQDIEKSREETRLARESMEREKQDYQAKLSAMKADLDRSKADYEKKLESAKKEARDLVQEARDQAQRMLREAKKAIDQVEDTRGLDRALTSVNDQAKAMEGRLGGPDLSKRKKAPHQAPQGLKSGEAVEILTIGDEGRIVEGPDKNGDVMVQVGILKVKANVKDLRRIEDDRDSSPNQTQTRLIIQRRKDAGISLELDLRGERYESALDRVDRYLDDAVLAGMEKVRIIHGKGTGALRQGVQDLLARDRRVKSYTFAKPDQGGTGVTEVELK